jgi:hypothetical protein
MEVPHRSPKAAQRILRTVTLNQAKKVSSPGRLLGPELVTVSRGLRCHLNCQTQLSLEESELKYNINHPKYARNSQLRLVTSVGNSLVPLVASQLLA